MCHAPIVVPAVGGPRGEACRDTTRAMEQAARALVESEPDVLVLCSPHTPRLGAEFGLVDGPAVRGDLSRFGAPQVHVDLPADEDARRALEDAAQREGVTTGRIAPGPLDHGAMVPLAFVWDAGFRGRTLLFSFPARDSHDACLAMGRAVRRAAEARGERWALLASGDMSHRLIEGAPSGFHPRARDFDERLTAHVSAGDLRAAATFDEDLRALAAEDVVESLDVARGALGDERAGERVLSYEGPYGVGYLVAVLHDEGASAAVAPDDDAAAEERALLTIAREAIAAVTDGADFVAPRLGDGFQRPMGVFVTLHSPGEQLRGCVGRMELDDARPFADQLADVAQSAATRDPRFPPVTSYERPLLSLELSLLGREEPCEASDLDPAVWGVSVASGHKRAVLLPGIDGIDTPSQQLDCVLRKAGIPPGAPFTLKRFPSRKIREHRAHTPKGGAA